MKLYTEEQLTKYLRNHSDIITRYDLQNIPHIELPSDKEIMKEVFYQKQVMNPYPTGEHSYTAYEKGFMDCAESILLKIQGGNK
jgi:hypothetical protein